MVGTLPTRTSTGVDVLPPNEHRTSMLVNTMLVVMMAVDVRERGEPMSDPGLACCTPLTGTPMSAEQAEQVVPLLKALADPVRLRLVSLIAASAGGEACVCDLNDAFDLTQATISHHLKVLHSAGLLDRDKRGVWVYYRIRPQALAGLGALMGSPPPR
jgi:ArsR family transcriptional regulator, arsenate/arsenite/antimonite-responsive transcriptional repressor